MLDHQQSPLTLQSPMKNERKTVPANAIFELTLVPSGPKRPEKRAAVLLKNRTPVGPYVGAQQK